MPNCVGCRHDGKGEYACILCQDGDQYKVAEATQTSRPLGSNAPACSDAVMSAAYAFVDSMVPRADDNILDSPLWHGWALRDAFVAGANFKK